MPGRSEICSARIHRPNSSANSRRRAGCSSGGTRTAYREFLAVLLKQRYEVGAISIADADEWVPEGLAFHDRVRFTRSRFGLRKAVGARGSDILTQFLIESLVLSIIGGMIGVALGWAATLLAGVLIPTLQVSLSADAIVLATAVSSFVGIFFGLYPASRAARMKPIDALRFE